MTLTDERMWMRMFTLLNAMAKADDDRGAMDKLDTLTWLSEDAAEIMDEIAGSDAMTDGDPVIFSLGVTIDVTTDGHGASTMPPVITDLATGLKVSRIESAHYRVDSCEHGFGTSYSDTDSQLDLELNTSTVPVVIRVDGDIIETTGRERFSLDEGHAS